jgi:hypothetical protein
MTPTSTSTTSNTMTLRLGRSLGLGAIGGMMAAMVMAMFAMVASVTYQHHGFFTPLFHISALIGTPHAMMTSVHQAAAGNRFWFTPGAALVGLGIHMTTGAAFGMMFALIARVVPRHNLLVAGALYGLAMFAGSAFVDLPAAASITGSGDVIANMARTVGLGTFAVEHILYGVALAGFLLAATRGSTSANAPAGTQPVTVAA